MVIALARKKVLNYIIFINHECEWIVRETEIVNKKQAEVTQNPLNTWHARVAKA